MGCFDECLDGISEPYGGNMPLFKSSDTTDATVTIIQESYDDGMSVTRINTPPRTNTNTLLDVINNILGFMCPTKEIDGQKNEKPSYNNKGGENDDEVSDGSRDKTEPKRWFGSEDNKDRVAEKTQPVEKQEQDDQRRPSR